MPQTLDGNQYACHEVGNVLGDFISSIEAMTRVFFISNKPTQILTRTVTGIEGIIEPSKRIIYIFDN